MCSRGQGIRETVRVLLTLLADCNCPHIPSESFRLAKFNKPEALEPFWRTLHHLASLHLLLQSGDLRDLSDAAKDCSHSSDIPHIALCVRKLALDLGYERPQFYVERVGSRELLLFFAWLIQEASLVSRLQIYHVCAALHTMSIPLSPSKTFLLDSIETTTDTFDAQLEALVSSAANSSPLEGTLRKIQWLKGTLAGSGRSVENAHRAAVRFSHNILHSTRSQAKRASGLSLHDLFLLRYPDQLAACVKRLEWHVSCLEGLARWRQHETLFWQWMESVLDILARPQQPDGDNNDDDESVELGEGDKLKEEVYQCQLKLSSAIGECLQTFGASRESSLKCKEPNKTKQQLRLQGVAVENSLLRHSASAQRQQPQASMKESPHNQREIEGELRRLRARLLEEERSLHSLQSTLAACIV